MDRGVCVRCDYPEIVPRPACCPECGADWPRMLVQGWEMRLRRWMMWSLWCVGAVIVVSAGCFGWLLWSGMAAMMREEPLWAVAVVIVIGVHVLAAGGWGLAALAAWNLKRSAASAALVVWGWAVQLLALLPIAAYLLLAALEK